MKRLFQSFLLMSQFACDSSTGPERVESTLDFGIQRPQTEPAFLVTPSEDAIHIRGYFEELCTGYTAQSRATLENGVLKVTISGRHPDACHPAITSIGYEATVTAPRSFASLVVVHEWKGTNMPADTVYTLAFLDPD